MVEDEKNTQTAPVENSEELSSVDEAAGKKLMEKILSAFSGEDSAVVENKEAEYIEKIARLQAEFENYRKRTEKEKHENLVNANANLISDLLPTLDHFELALKHNKDKGIALIYDELVKVLEKQGLTVIDTKGTFNPKIHEVVIKVDGEKDGVILEEIQKGYLLNDKLLRASKVKISKTQETK